MKSEKSSLMTCLVSCRNVVSDSIFDKKNMLKNMPFQHFNRLICNEDLDRIKKGETELMEDGTRKDVQQISWSKNRDGCITTGEVVVRRRSN